MENTFDKLMEKIDEKKDDYFNLLVSGMNIVSLAFVGDAVFSLFIRTTLVLNHDFNAATVNKEANRFVKATAQATMLDSLFPTLIPDEQAFVKRARNYHTNNKAKNASVGEYKKATALEALFGYYYLSELNEKLQKAMEFCVDVIEKGKACS